MIYTRREIGGMMLAALSASRLRAKPNSRFAGVQIGVIISPYNYPEIPLAADQLLPKLVELGISAIELQDVRAEVYAGAPQPVREGYSGSPRSQASLEERKEARKKAAEDLTNWRRSAPLEKYLALRRLYDDAGVKIYAFRLATVSQTISDEEYKYFFHAAQALGANQITVELPADLALIKRVADFASRNKIRMGYHNHTQVNQNSWDAALAESPYNGINFDVGHYAAAVNQSPVPFIQSHYERITSLHLKDRKFRSNGGENKPWGEGNTPLVEILRLIRDEKYTFPAAIELEYPIPAGSSALAEIGKCLHFSEKALA